MFVQQGTIIVIVSRVEPGMVSAGTEGFLCGCRVALIHEFGQERQSGNTQSMHILQLPARPQQPDMTNKPACDVTLIAHQYIEEEKCVRIRVVDSYPGETTNEEWYSGRSDNHIKETRYNFDWCGSPNGLYAYASWGSEQPCRPRPWTICTGIDKLPMFGRGEARSSSPLGPSCICQIV